MMVTVVLVSISTEVIVSQKMIFRGIRQRVWCENWNSIFLGIFVQGRMFFRSGFAGLRMCRVVCCALSVGLFGFGFFFRMFLFWINSLFVWFFFIFISMEFFLFLFLVMFYGFIFVECFFEIQRWEGSWLKCLVVLMSFTWFINKFGWIKFS